METSARTLLIDSLRDFRRTWPQLILTDLLVRILAVVIFTPLIGLLIKAFLATTGTGVLTDAGIVSFLVHPIGIAALLLVGTASLGLLFAETGQLMVIGFGSVEDRRVTWLDALRYSFWRVVRLVSLAWSGFVRLLPLALPFFAVAGGLYWLLTRRYDINYLLVRKPPEFLAAVGLAGLILALVVALIVGRIARWLLALPLVLFEGMGGKEALRASEQATLSQRRRITLWLATWCVAAVLMLGLVTVLFGLVGDVLVPYGSSNLKLLVAGLSVLLVAHGLASLAVTVCATTLFPLLVVRLYRSLGGPGELSPELAPRGSLGERASLRLPGKGILAASAVALLVVAGGAYLALARLDGGERAQIIAHRGGAAVAPENTLAAFERGIADGTDWLELDVQEDADGVVVVTHDSDYMRVAGVRLAVFQATKADLAKLDVGSSFGPGFSDQRVPTLREVLELAKGHAGLFIELKYYGHDRNLEAKVVELVEQTGMESNIVIMSLDYDGVRKTAALRPGWTYGFLNAVAIGDLTRLDVEFLALTASAASFATIHHAHRRGMKVYAWTVDDPVQMSVMMSRGVDGIITDRVALAHHVQETRARLTPLGRFVVWMAGEAGLLRGVEKSSARDDA